MSATTASRGRRVKGPSALGSDPRRFVHLTATLAITDFKLRFFGSVLGYLWQLMRPLMLFGVLYVVFTRFVRLGDDIPHYPVVLLTSIVLFTFFAEATGGAVGSVLERESLVRKIEFPRMVIPLTVVVNAGLNLALNFLAVLIFMLASGVRVRWTWLELPFLIGALTVLCTGVALLLSALFVRFRDLKPIWDVVTQLAFYGSPVLYAIESVPGSMQGVIMASPLAAILQQVRHAVVDPGAPSAADAIGAPERLIIPVMVVVAVFALGLWVFNREAPRIAEEL